MDLDCFLKYKSHGNKSQYLNLLKIAFIDNLLECINKSRYKDNLIIRCDLLNKCCNNKNIDNTIYITTLNVKVNRYNVNKLLTEIFYYSKDIDYDILNIYDLNGYIMLNVGCYYNDYDYIIPLKVNSSSGYPKGKLITYKSFINNNKYNLITYTNIELLSQIFMEVITTNISIKRYYDLYNLYVNYKINNNKLRKSIYNVFSANKKILNTNALYIVMNSISNNKEISSKWNEYCDNVEFSDFIKVVKQIIDIL